MNAQQVVWLGTFVIILGLAVVIRWVFWGTYRKRSAPSPYKRSGVAPPALVRPTEEALAALRRNAEEDKTMTRLNYSVPARPVDPPRRRETPAEVPHQPWRGGRGELEKLRTESRVQHMRTDGGVRKKEREVTINDSSPYHSPMTSATSWESPPPPAPAPYSGGGGASGSFDSGGGGGSSE